MGCHPREPEGWKGRRALPSLNAPMPAGAAKINAKNNLHLAPSNMLQNQQHPWYLYDSVHPTLLYQQMDNDYDWNEHINSLDVSEGNEPDALSTLQDQKKPVTVHGYV